MPRTPNRSNRVKSAPRSRRASNKTAPRDAVGALNAGDPETSLAS